MNQNIIPIESILERDVDLILLEELSTDATFCQWFTAKLALPSPSAINGAWRSISAFGLGETDILFSYQANEKKIFVLIENKLDADFQNEQFIRYEKRAQEYMANYECDWAFTVLIAPKLYCENQTDFENSLTYESIAEKFESVGTKRSTFKSQLLRIAVEKLRRGYQPVNSIPVQSFWLSYWQYRQAHFPNLTMKKPDIVPHNSDWPMLYDERLKEVVFYHKLAQGNVDATFKCLSIEKEKAIKEQLPKWAIMVKHSKSISIRVPSKKIDRTKDFQSQIMQVEEGLKDIEQLRDWIIANKNLFDSRDSS